MISELPEFRWGKEYEMAVDGNWLFTFQGDRRIKLNLPIHGNASFRDRAHREWARLEDDELVIRDQYSWDGPTHSPAFKKAMLPSAIHDVLYQFLNTEHMRERIDKATADLLFYHAMKTTGFWLRGPYYHVVKKLGHLYLRDRSNVHSVLLP
jgi:hypothetical protein